MSFQCEEPAEKVCSIQFHDIRGKKVRLITITGSQGLNHGK